MEPDAAQLFAALGAIHPRAARILRTLAAARLDLEAFSATWGLTPAQAAVLVLDAADELDRALGGAPPAEARDERAAALRRALPGEAPPALAALRDHAATVEARFHAQAAAHEADPRRRTESVLRWVAVAAVVAWWAWNELHR